MGNWRVSEFGYYCDANTYCIQFTHVVDPISLVFLDLVLLWDQESKVISKTHFKETAGNSYLHKESCRHPRWKNNYTYSQFCRLRRNCANSADYLTQAEVLTKTFIKKGYHKDHRQRVVER